ncbi:tyrosine-type recombinase/integrase [Pontiella sulfatireligans]|uniref:Tyr recombinase domain-containing protein n=1 Tax=Pontiella sulfatireligans TaxID=2750658 RepID=A0A6C2UEZ1_9BACT|nr:site-specific integrase [Pontiella sulfatireligans]VGO18782.1 hypothetical protein SCARR_00835 [Pontiella sulfatireligans]
MDIDKKPTARKRSTKGKGSLFIRDKQRKRYKAGSTVKDGTYWLEYWEPTREEDGKGNPKKKKRRIPLKHSRNIPAEGIQKGDPVTKINHARHEQDRIITRHVLTAKEDRLAVLVAELDKTGKARAKAEDSAAPPLSLANTWKAFRNSNHADAPSAGIDTWKNYKGHWQAFLAWLYENDQPAEYLRDVTPQISSEYISQLRKRFSATTFNNHLGLLILLFDVLKKDSVADSRLTINPFKDLRKEDRKQQSRRELSIPELRTIIDSADGELKTLLLLGASTGLRLGDCCTLQWSEIAFPKRQILRIPNKAKHLKDSKPIKVGMPPELVSRLLESPERSRKGFVLPEHAKLYTYRNNTGRLSQQPKIARRIQKHFEACGIKTHREGTGPTPEFWKTYNKWLRNGKEGERPTHPRAIIEVGFHSLRHTYVSLQAQRGVPQSVVQKIVGHGNPAMTQRYLHITDETAESATLSLYDGIADAEYEEIRTVPDWIKERLKGMTAENWEQIKKEFV